MSGFITIQKWISKQVNKRIQMICRLYNNLKKCIHLYIYIYIDIVGNSDLLEN